MKRSCIAVALALTSACTVGPAFIGETAESSTGLQASDDDVFTTDDGVDTSSNIGSCETSCIGGPLWSVLLDGPAHELVIAADDTPLVVLAMPGAMPELQPFALDGTPGPRTPFGHPMAGSLRDAVRDDASAGLVFSDSMGYVLQGLAPDFTTTSWERERVPAGFQMVPHDVGLGPDSALVVAGLSGGSLLVPFVHGYDATGEPMFVWEPPFDETDVYFIALLDDPEAITLWVRIGEEDEADGYVPVDEHIVRLAADGTQVSNDFFVTTTVGLLEPLRHEGGWVAIGDATENGGVRFEFFDTTFSSSMIVDDPDIAPEDYKFPIEALTTPTGFAVLVWIDRHESSFEVRSYDQAGALLGSTALTPAAVLFSMSADLEVASDGTLYVLTDWESSSDMQHETLLHRIASF